MSGTIRLQREDAEWLLHGALAAASKDDITPILCALHWKVENGRVTVTATDRYRVHQLHVEIGDKATVGEFLMSRTQASRLLRSWHTPRKLYEGQVLDLTWTNADTLPTGHKGMIARRYHGSIRADVFAHDGNDADRITLDMAQVRGTFPPVTRLFDVLDDAERVTEVSLTPELLNDLKWLRRDRHAPLVFMMPPKREQGSHPMLIENGLGTARALVQPSNLIEPRRYE